MNKYWEVDGSPQPSGAEALAEDPPVKKAPAGNRPFLCGIHLARTVLQEKLQKSRGFL